MTVPAAIQTYWTLITGVKPIVLVPTYLPAINYVITQSIIITFLLVSAITGGATYIVISRPDGSTVSEIVQNASETAISHKE